MLASRALILAAAMLVALPVHAQRVRDAAAKPPVRTQAQQNALYPCSPANAGIRFQRTDGAELRCDGDSYAPVPTDGDPIGKPSACSVTGQVATRDSSGEWACATPEGGGDMLVDEYGGENAGEVAVANRLKASRLRFAGEFLDGSETCGLQEAHDSFPSDSRGGTIYAASTDECDTWTAQLVISRHGLTIDGLGMGRADLNTTPTLYKWGGAEDTPMVKVLKCHGCEFNRFSMHGNDVPGATAWHLEPDGASGNTITHSAWRNISIRRFDRAVLMEGVDDVTFNDQASELIFDNVEVREVDVCYEINGRQMVGININDGELSHRYAEPCIKLIRGWVNITGPNAHSRRWGYCSTTDTLRCRIGNNDCPGEETCEEVESGPLFWKGVNAGVLNVHNLYTELSSPLLECETGSQNGLPINFYGSRMNISEFPDGDIDLITCDQPGPITMNGAQISVPGSGTEKARFEFGSTPVFADGAVTIAGARTPNEDRFEWVPADPRLDRDCKTLQVPDGIEAGHEAQLVSMSWGTTIRGLRCRTDTGTLRVNVQRDDGTPADIATADLDCSPSWDATVALEAAESVLAFGESLRLVVDSVQDGEPTEVMVCWDHRR